MRLSVSLFAPCAAFLSDVSTYRKDGTPSQNRHVRPLPPPMRLSQRQGLRLVRRPSAQRRLDSYHPHQQGKPAAPSAEGRLSRHLLIIIILIIIIVISSGGLQQQPPLPPHARLGGAAEFGMGDAALDPLPLQRVQQHPRTCVHALDGRGLERQSLLLNGSTCVHTYIHLSTYPTIHPSFHPSIPR